MVEHACQTLRQGGRPWQTFLQTQSEAEDVRNNTDPCQPRHRRQLPLHPPGAHRPRLGTPASPWVPTPRRLERLKHTGPRLRAPSPKHGDQVTCDCWQLDPTCFTSFAKRLQHAIAQEGTHGDPDIGRGSSSAHENSYELARSRKVIESFK